MFERLKLQGGRLELPHARQWVRLAVVSDRPLTLTLKLDGPLVEEHRLPLSELLRVGKQLRDSLRDVAIVLTHHGPSGTSGRSKKEIESAADLRVVGAPRAGSFALDLEVPPTDVPAQVGLPGDLGLTLSEQAIVAFLDGLDSLSDESEELPVGFDRGVLRAVVPFNTALKKGLTEISLTTSQNGDRQHAAAITATTVQVARRLISQPVTAGALVEGVLQMVDFGSLACRIDRPPLSSVNVYFEEKDRDLVHQAVRQVVRVSGEGRFEPDSNEPSTINATSIEIVYEALELDVNAFWEEKAITTLAEEQETPKFSIPKEFEADPWRDDDAAAQLIEAIQSWD
jgi:hypothetical protein